MLVLPHKNDTTLSSLLSAASTGQAPLTFRLIPALLPEPWNAIFASSVAAYASSHAGTPGVGNAAAIHGYTAAFAWAAGIFALGLLFALVVLPSKRKSNSSPLEKAVDAGTAIASKAPAPATAILVTGPCCHFGVTVHLEHITPG